MKRLKKDLPFAKAGTPVFMYRGEWIIEHSIGHTVIGTQDMDMTDWIEEVKPREWDVVVIDGQLVGSQYNDLSFTDNKPQKIQVREII